MDMGIGDHRAVGFVAQVDIIIACSCRNIEVLYLRVP